MFQRQLRSVQLRKLTAVRVLPRLVTTPDAGAHCEGRHRTLHLLPLASPVGVGLPPSDKGLLTFQESAESCGPFSLEEFTNANGQKQC